MSYPRDIVIVQSAWPPYRQAFLNEFLRRAGTGLKVISGDRQFAVGVSQGVEFPDYQFYQARNRFVFGRRALWQSRVMSRVIKPSVAILELNPRIINTWTALIVRRALRRPTILWGHAWPRMGPSNWTDRIRQVQRRLADILLLYTDEDAYSVGGKAHGTPVFSAPNALYAVATMGSNKTATLTDIIFSGRLVPEKKPHLLLEAFIEARLDSNEPLSEYAALSFVGDGPLAAALQRRAEAAGVKSRVHFHGSVWHPRQLQRIYDRAFVAVSSGYAGLNVVQASSFGTRIMVADAEPHAPEISYFKVGMNGAWFRSDSIEDLVRVITSEWRHRARARSSAEDIVKWARANCSVEVMVEGFVAAIDYATVGLR